MTEETFKIICLAVCLFGLLIRIYTVGYTPANTSGRNTAEGQVADVVNTTGIYSTVRHPLYVGNFFMWLGIAMLTENLWFVVAFCLMYWVYYERIMYAEEQFLRKKFAERYTDWAARTPAFIPSFKNFKKPSIPFSIKKVLKNEKNGLLAIFVLIYLFELVALAIDGQLEASWNQGIWFYGFIGSGILYIILKGIKKADFMKEQGR